jgi:hypothetical protein
MKRILFVAIMILCFAQMTFSQTTTLPASLGTFNVFRESNVPATIVMPPGYPIVTPKVEVWNNGIRLSDTTAVVVSGDTLKFTITKQQLAPLVRNAYLFIKNNGDYILGAAIIPTIGVGIPNTILKEVKLPSNEIVRVSLIGGQMEAELAASKAKQYRDSTQTLLNLAGSTMLSRKKVGSIAQLRANTELIDIYEVVDPVIGGTFIYNSTNTTGTDDGIMTIVQGTKRYERKIDQYASLSWWVTPNGTTDNTAAIQAAINHPRVRTLFIPKTAQPYRLNTISITQSNKHIIFEDGAEFFGLGNDYRADHAPMIDVVLVDNVHISGKGWLHDMKETYPTGTSGQFQGCFRIRGTTGLVIEDLLITNVGGDGVHLTAGSGNRTNLNTRIQNVTVDNFARNGVSVITCENCWIDKCRFTNGVTSFPGNGIDVEPNYNYEKAIGIKLTNIYTANNVGGILVALRHMVNSSTLSDVIVDNHTDDGSNFGFTIQVSEGGYTGAITNSNSVWRNPKITGCLIFAYSNTAPRIVIKNPTVINPATQDFYGHYAAFLFMINPPDTSTNFMGNVHIYEPEILDNRTPIPPYYGFELASNWTPNTLYKWKDVSIINPRKIQTLNQWSAMACFQCDDFPIFEDRYRSLVKDADAVDITIRSAYGLGASEALAYYRTITNKGATALRSHTLSHLNANKTVVTFEVQAAQILRISPVTAWTLKPYMAVNQAIQSSVVGSKITFTKDNATASWIASEVIGTWTDASGNVVFGPQPSYITNPSSSVQTNSSLNALYSGLRAGTIVNYPNIAGGGRKYRKLSDSTSGTWEETLATGAFTILP